MPTAPGAVLLGTVAVEPNRWRTVDPSGAPVVALAEWADEIASLGVDGCEIWERHLLDAADPDAVVALAGDHGLYNSYVSFDDGDDGAFSTLASVVTDHGFPGVKFNVGNDPSREDEYVDRIVRLSAAVPASVQLLCECHARISIAEDPAVAARIFAATELPPERLGAIVHTHDVGEPILRCTDAYADRIAHVHVNFLDFTTMTAPPLADRVDALARVRDQLGAAGCRPSWTLEFVEGVMTDHDEPAHLLQQAARDIAVLRDVVG